MSLKIAITAADGVVFVPLDQGPVSIDAAPGQRYSVVDDTAGIPVALDAAVSREGDDLIVTTPDGQVDLTIARFFSACGEGVASCELSVAELGGGAGQTITPASEPIGAQPQGGFLLFASPGLGTVLPEERGSEFPWRPVAGVGGGLLLLGAAAGGGGGNSAVASDSTPPAAPGLREDFTTNSNFPVIAGTAEPGSAVRITIGIGNTGQRVSYDTRADADGNWSIDTASQQPVFGVMPPDGLPDDVPSSLSAVATDGNGNVSPVAQSSIQIDTVAPVQVASVTEVRSDAAAPVDENGLPSSAPGLELGPGIVPNGGATNDATPTIEGTIDEPLAPGDRVIVYRDGVPVGVAVVNGLDWTFTDTATPAGDHVYTARVTDPAGNASPEGAAASVTVDGTPPVAPTIDPVSGDNRLTFDDTQQPLVVTGSGEAGSRVLVTFGAVTASGVVGADGRWSVNFDGSTLPGNGERNISAVAIDDFGNRSTGDSQAVSVNTGLPTAPVIDTGAASVLGGPVTAINAAESAGGFQISGEADPGNAVVVTFTPLGGGSVVQATAVTDASGRFTVSFAPGALAQGNWSAQASAVDGVGNVIEGPVVAVLVDTVAPSGTPQIGSVTGNEGNTAQIGSGGSINDASPTLRGSAPGSANGDFVVVSRDGAVVGRAVVSNGSWTFTDRDVPDGSHTYTAVVTDPAGNVGPASSSAFALVVDTVAPSAPAINAVAGDDVVSGSEAAAGVVVGGRGEAGTTVRVDWAGQTRDAIVDGNGNWSVRFDRAPADGRTQVTATVTDAAGNESSAFRVVTVDTQPPAPPSIGAVGTDNIINAGEAAGGVTVSGRAEPGTTITVSWAGITAQATTTEAGFWSVTYASPPAQGASTISAIASDAGQTTSTATTREVFVDTVAPAAPIINPVAGDNVVDAGEAAAGITVSGQGQAGAAIAVDWAGATRTTTASAAGTWSVSFDVPPANGASTISVVATDGAGNASVASTAAVTVDTTPAVVAPPPPVISAVGGDGVVNAAEASAGVTVTGTAAVGSAVAVTWGGTTVNAAVSASGAWSASFAAGAVPTASTPVSAIASNAGGSSAAASLPVTIDRTAPGAPVINVVEGDNTITAPEAADGVIVTGTAEAGSQVVATWGTLTATATATGTGAWSATFNSVPGQGASTITAVATDSAGNASAAGSRSVVVDTTPAVPVPPPPTIAPVTGNGVVNAAEAAAGVTVTGTAQPGAAVAVSWGAATASATATASGTWSVTFSPAQVPATDTPVSAVASNASGSSAATSLPVAIDRTAPPVPVLNPVEGDNIVSPAEAADGVAMSGTAEADSVVTVSWAGNTETATASATGAWSVSFDAPAAPGDYVVNVGSADAAGNNSAGVTRTITVSEPAPPVTPPTVPDENAAGTTANTFTIMQSDLLDEGTLLFAEAGDTPGDAAAIPTGDAVSVPPASLTRADLSSDSGMDGQSAGAALDTLFEAMRQQGTGSI